MQNIIKNKNSTVALCIPAYNAARFLPRILTSAKNQYIPFDEILVYNDCSTDNTKDVAKQYGAVVIDGDINRGCSFGKNVLASKTSCKWIHFHDADDDMYPNFTTLAHKWISKQNPPDVVLFDYEYRNFEDNSLIAITKFNNDKLQEDAIKYSIMHQINPFCGLYNKKKFLEAGGYDTDPMILYNEDVAMHFKIASYGLKFGSESEISIINFKVSNSMSGSNKLKCIRAQYYVYLKMAEKFADKYNVELNNKILASTRHAAFFEDWKLVRKMLRLAIELNNKENNIDSRVFKILYKINPFVSFYLREKLNQIFRANYKKRELW